MSERIHSRVPMHRRVEYRHTRGNGEGLLMDPVCARLSDQKPATYPSPVGRD